MRREKLRQHFISKYSGNEFGRLSHAYAYGLDKLWRQIQPDFGKSEG